MNKHNLHNYTAADIARYHGGEMSPPERHALEKAALEDPFLADALEGYAAIPGAEKEIPILRDKISQRAATPVVSIGNRRQYFWRAAAIIVLVAGAAWLTFEFTGNTPTDLALETGSEKNVQSTPVQNKDSITNQSAFENKEIATGEEPTIAKESKPVENKSAIARPAEQQEQLDDQHGSEEIDLKISKKEEISKSRQPQAGITKEPSVEPKAAGAAKENMKREVFRGRVVDESGNPLPFANVTNVADEVGTYADVNGYFTLTSPDTSLEVQVRSLGFETRTEKIKPGLKENQIVLDEEQMNADAMVVNRRLNSTPARTRTTELEEPEPADGWTNYDTYILNNLRVPENYQERPKGPTEVEVSFEVNEDGRPVNIRVEHSVCSVCDSEAMRLIRQGPSWKYKPGRQRVKVKVPF